MPPPCLPILSENNQTTTNSPPIHLLHGSTNDISRYSSAPITLKFIDLSYTVKLANPATSNRLIAALNSPPPVTQTYKTIISGITGAAFPGEILAVLGPSGSGKSTLLKALSGRLNPLTGTLLANGERINRSFVRRVGFVSQDDVLYTHLTVREILIFCSLLRLPNWLSKSDKIKAAESVISELGLTKCEDTVIGNGFVRGVSGGERKRVSIAHEMLVNPSLLILDEPTSGLDSTAAHRLVATLRTVAQRGNRTIVASMHQPSSRLYQMVDKILVLSEGVSLYYGNAKEAMTYFESVGFSPAFPVNPADFLLDLANDLAKPTPLQADYAVAPDFSTAIRSSSSRLPELVFVVNPKGANGRTGEDWKRLLPYVRSRLGGDCIICESLTSGPAHAIDITREAIRQGADAVIAVGGDGTLHEVVNGFFWAGKTVKNNDREATYSTALGLIPLGTGSDFARTFGWRNDPHEAIERISRGLRSKVDVGVISGGDGEFHYFINVADIHLSAKAGYYSSRYKRFGNLCYVIGALQGFMEHKNQDFRIKVDDGDWEMCPQVTTMCIGNAKFFGGGMKITPYADPSSGNLEVVTLQDFKWYDFILKMHKLYNGTHLSVKNVTSRRVQSIEVEDMSDSSIFVQSDGEHLGFLPRKFHILPAAIEMLT